MKVVGVYLFCFQCRGETSENHLTKCYNNFLIQDINTTRFSISYHPYLGKEYDGVSVEYVTYKATPITFYSPSNKNHNNTKLTKK